MKINKDVLLFDLDGTLTDSADGIINSIKHSRDVLGLGEPDCSYFVFVGPPLMESYTVHFGLSEERAREAVKVYRERYSAIGWKENSVYDGVEDMLKGLKAKGKTLLVATSKPEKFARQILGYFNLDKYFDFIGGCDLEGKLATKADVINYVFDTMNLKDKSRAIMIGDRYHDVYGAKNAGIDCIGVTYGYGDRAELEEAGAKYVFDTAEEVEKAF